MLVESGDHIHDFMFHKVISFISYILKDEKLEIYNPPKLIS